MLSTVEQISRVRSLVDEPVASIATDTEITDWLADAGIGIITAIREKYPEKLQKQYTLTTVVGQEEYAPPTDFHKVIYVADSDGTAVFASPLSDGVSILGGKFHVKPIPTAIEEYKITYIVNTDGIVNDNIPLANIAYAVSQYFKKDRNFTAASAYMAEYVSLIGKIVRDVGTPATRRGVFNRV